HAKERVILSSHDFAGTPADLADRARAMRESGAAVVKLAATANSLSDCLPLAAIGREWTDGRMVLIGMGERGMTTRVLPGRFGSAWTYAGRLAGVGQLDVPTLLNQYRFRDVTSSTRLYGLVGSGVGPSVSSAMHNAAFRAASVDAVCLPLPARDADDFVT